MLSAEDDGLRFVPRLHMGGEGSSRTPWKWTWREGRVGCSRGAAGGRGPRKWGQMDTDSGWCSKKPVELTSPPPRLGAPRLSWEAQLPNHSVKDGPGLLQDEL